MEFFDRKEEVMEIELTSYGKSLFSRGLFNPVYYDFVDSDILYDNQYAGENAEAQTETHDRITETPRLKIVAITEDLEKLSNKTFESEKESEGFGVKILSDNPGIGLSENTSNYAPAWNIGFVGGAIQSVTGSGIERFPLIDLQTINYQVLGEKDAEVEGYNLPDGTTIYVSGSSLILDIVEENVTDNKDNFDVRFLLYNENEDDYKPLVFKERVSNIRDGILLDKTEESNVEITPEFIEYYFDVLEDRRIDGEGKQQLCAYGAFDKKDISFLDYGIDCEEVKESQPKLDTSKLYSSRTPENKLGEKCRK